MWWPISSPSKEDWRRVLNSNETVRFLKLKYTLPLLLITVAAIAGVQLFYRYVEQKLVVDSPTAAAPTGAPGGQATAVVPEKLDKPIDVAAITRRNLFASRDKALPVVEQKPQPEIGPSSLAVVLMGTITGSDGVERAIIYDKKERKQELYQEGDYLQQAAVKDIMRGKVIISLNGRDEILDIAEARDVKVPQYKKPGPPVTSTQRVQGRPVQRRQMPGGPEDQEQTEQRVVVPQPGDARQMNMNKQGVIIKGRAASHQQEQVN